MPRVKYSFTGKIDRRNPRNKGDFDSPYMRENLLARDNRLSRPKGTERLVSTLTGKVTWMTRYYTIETGIVSPKTFAYAQDGTIWYIDEFAGTATLSQSNLKINIYPRSAQFKLSNQTLLFLVDEVNLWKYDGNNDYKWEKVPITDTDGNTINPIDIIEHADRLCLISDTYLFISKNLEPTIFNDSTDSLQIIIGSGKGKNFAVRKLNGVLYIFNTEGIFALIGDTISAVASTFDIRPVDERKIIARRSACNVENAIIFLADDLNIWSWDGAKTTKLSHLEKLEELVNPNRESLDKAIATYHENYYKLSLVETGQFDNDLEIWWDALEDKIDFVKGRKVSCYMESDPTREALYQLLGRSDQFMIMWANRGYNFDQAAIVSRLWTKDIVINDVDNVRFVAFYPELEPIGDRNISISYLLDGRLGVISNQWTQNLEGEYRSLGLMHINNQSQFVTRIRPAINYAKGRSIAFYIYDFTKDLRFDFLGMGIEFRGKHMKKGKVVGQ